MIIPSIDLQSGRCVQLIGGETPAIDAGDPRLIAERFRLAGEIAVIDLDAARGKGGNGGLIRELLSLASCRIGGGIRDAKSAWRWLEAGAAKIILGSAAERDILAELPREHTIAALDAVNGDIVINGWRTRTGRTVRDRITELRDLIGGFLITFVEHEGRMTGLPMDLAAEYVELAKPARLTIAGGVRDIADIAGASRLGADVQVGMALYTGAIHLADAITAPLRSDRSDGLWPTIVTDECGVALGLAYSNAESVRQAVSERRGIYWSRARNSLWHKGDSSGNTQELLRIALDCDLDTLRFTVRQHGRGFCHTGSASCFGSLTGLRALEFRLQERTSDAPVGSYTAQLFRDASLLRSKLIEEAAELAQASTREEVIWEAADMLYFTLAAMARAGVSLPEVERELSRRERAPRRGTLAPAAFTGDEARKDAAS